jgi:hypothetical protein
MAFKAVGQETTSILTIQFTTEGGSAYLINADSAPTLTISKDAAVVETITSPTNSSTGVYEAAWTPATAGEYSLLWEFTVSGTDYSSTDTIFALTEASEVDVPDAPDVGSSNTCTLTGTFIDAAGDYKQGVYVRFTPNTEDSRLTGVGFVAGDVTAVSDATGAVSFTVVRGITGLLAISGTSLVRNVTIPDQSTIDIFELAAQGDDLLEVQELELTELPRRS